MKLKPILAACALALAAGGAQAVATVTTVHDATDLATVITGSGITFSNATLLRDGVDAAEASGGAEAGTFTGGADTVGFDSGVVLTNGRLNCVQGPNDRSCGEVGNGFSTALAFDFTAATNKVSLQYVFASEEYYAPLFDVDFFTIILDGTEISLLPDGTTKVSLSSVNCDSNSEFFRPNVGTAPCFVPGAEIDIQYNGLTVVLTATANLVGDADTLHHIEFLVADPTDTLVDSALFIREGSFTALRDTPPTGVPEPTSLALAGLALLGLAGARRRRARAA